MKTELEGRTKEFSVGVVRLIRAFPKTVAGNVILAALLAAGLFSLSRFPLFAL